MKGSVYSREKCFICGASLVMDDRRRGCFCPNHPQVAAVSKFYVRFDDVFKNFKHYTEAERFLTGLRYKTDEGSFDSRDYRESKPLGFSNLADKYLNVKKFNSSEKHFANLKRCMEKAKNLWVLTNIKDIGYGEIEDFLFSQGGISEKTRANMKSCLHDFWQWLRRRKVLTLQQMPDFPEITFELGWRKIIDKATQEKIIEQVKTDTFHINPKIWLGIRWLSIYIAARPGELLKMKEDDIDLNMGVIFIPHPKEKRPKTINLLPEDIEILKSMPRGLPHLRFFRHPKGVSGVAAGQPFGDKYLYKHWKKACTKLGVEGVDLYGGTRHSTATALREFYSPEEIRRNGTRHSSKAFERYLQAQNNDSLQMAQVSTQITKGKVVSIKKAR